MSVFLHIDMDAFFAAVEVLDNPEWKGKPVIVGADPMEGKGRGVVSTASYEARKFGVHSAMPISQAWRRCPHGVYVRPRMSRYGDVSNQVMTIFKDFTPLIQPISLDEAFLDVEGSIRLLGDPVAIARMIKKKILEEVGLTCSVGVSWVKSVAKIASDMEKPDGLTVVPEGKEREFLAPLEVRSLWGVGPKAAEVFERAGMRTVGHIQKRSLPDLVSLFGKAAGEHYWNMANAIDPREVVDDEEALSVSHETTFLADVQDEDTVSRTLLWLADKVASRLRALGIRGRVITLKYRTEDFETFTRRTTLREGVQDTNTILEVASRLAGRLHRKGRRVRLLGIGVSRLAASKGVQLSLFGGEKKSKQQATDEAVDKVRRRFGKDAIIRGSLLDEEKDSK